MFTSSVNSNGFLPLETMLMVLGVVLPLIFMPMLAIPFRLKRHSSAVDSHSLYLPMGMSFSKLFKSIRKSNVSCGERAMLTVSDTDEVKAAFDLMEKHSISQLPVINESGEFVGAVNDHHLLSQLLKNPGLATSKINEVMQASFPMVAASTSIDQVSGLISKENPAVLVKELSGTVHILTKYDLIGALAG